jgi:drug/metabolite transporter (DMT)-like permease
MFGHRAAPGLVLMLATLVWGVSFVVTRAAVQSAPPLVFVGLRFATAALFVAAATRPALQRLSRTELTAGLVIGAAMFGGYGLQAMGMGLGISSGRAAFISALYVPMVPLLQMAILRRRPAASVWLGLALACAGMMLMSGPIGAQADGQPQAGLPEALILGGAFCIAAEIILISLFATRVDPRRLAVVECAILALSCLGVHAVSGQAWPAPSPGWIISGVALGLGSAGLQIAVNWAQRSVPPARATLIYTMEPVWACLFGLLAGERMGWQAVAGGALILASLLVSRGTGAEASPLMREEEPQHLG